jgi:hypothetical protein
MGLQGHLENYGRLPLIQLASTDATFAWNATETVAGHASYTAAVAAVAVSANATTAADQGPFVPGQNGLHGGIYQDSVAFVIQVRPHLVASTIPFLPHLSDDLHCCASSCRRVTRTPTRCRAAR